MSALTYSVPQNLRNIHAYHSDVLKLIEWSVKANQKAMGALFKPKESIVQKAKRFLFYL